jgi:hypothetical protein
LGLTQDIDRRSWRSSWGTWVLPVVLGFGSLVGTLGLSMQPPASGLVALLFPPWWDATKSLLAATADGAVVRFGALPFIVVVAPDASAAQIRRSGAWLVLNPQFGGCGFRPS